MNIQIENLKRKKKELKFTNKDISNGTGIPLQTIEKIFAGITASPRIDTIQAIAQFLGVSDTAVAVSQSGAVSDIVAETEEERDLLICFRSITRPAKDAIIANVHTAVMLYRSDK